MAGIQRVPPLAFSHPESSVVAQLPLWLPEPHEYNNACACVVCSNHIVIYIAQGLAVVKSAVFLLLVL